MTQPAKRQQSKAHRVASDHYPFICCVVCGLQLPGFLETAHLDHKSSNNHPDNLVKLCATHHKMVDARLYEVKTIKALRSYWQTNRDKSDHKLRMKDAGPRAAATRRANRAKIRRRISAFRAHKTRNEQAAAKAKGPAERASFLAKAKDFDRRIKSLQA